MIQLIVFHLKWVSIALSDFSFVVKKLKEFCLEKYVSPECLVSSLDSKSAASPGNLILLRAWSSAKVSANDLPAVYKLNGITIVPVMELLISSFSRVRRFFAKYGSHSWCIATFYNCRIVKRSSAIPSSQLCNNFKTWVKWKDTNVTYKTRLKPVRDPFRQ